MRIAGRTGDVRGVVGRKAAHLIRRDDKKDIELRDLWIDIGAKDRADARRRVDVGDPIVVDANFIHLTDDLCVSRSMDNRVGAFVALEAVRLLSQDRPRADVYAMAPTQEETSFAGAYTGSFQVAPMVAIAIDVTHATDYPEANKKSDGEVRLGGGPVLARGASVNQKVFEGLRAAGERLGLELPGARLRPLQRHRCRRDDPLRRRHCHRHRIDPKSLHALAERGRQPDRPDERGQIDRRVRSHDRRGTSDFRL